MSPYRVLVQNDSCEYKVLSAMLKTDVNCVRHIYILDKELVSKYDTVDYLTSSHKQTTRKNSKILASYKAVPTFDMRKYDLELDYGMNKRSFLLVSRNEFTLSDCLRSAMKHYCNFNKCRIEREL